jgi:hypothetical protein
VHGVRLGRAAGAAAGADRGGPFPRRPARGQGPRRRPPPRDPGEIRPPGEEGRPRVRAEGLLSRNLESLSPEKFSKVIETLDADGHGQQVLLAWIAKEKLRDALNLRARITGSQPCERQVRDRLFAFYDWCAQNEKTVPELVTLAGTVSRWEDEIVTAVLTGVTNATSESLNRIAKLEARMACGFRNPENQRRRVRIACTRAPGAGHPPKPANRNDP